MNNILQITIKTLRKLGYRNIRLVRLRKKYALIQADMDIIRVGWDKKCIYVTVAEINPYKAQVIWKSITMNIREY